MAATRILNLLKERRSAAFVTLTLFLLSFFFIVFTRFSNPFSSYQDLQSNPNPNPTPIIQANNSQIQEVEKDDYSITYSNPRPVQSNNSQIPEPEEKEDGVNSSKNQEKQAEEDDDESVEEVGIEWEKCKGVDYVPCLDNWKAIKALKSRRHMEHRERHCPNTGSRCLVPLPKGYKVPVPWPQSRDMVWYDNAPHSKLVEFKKEQNWVRKSGDYFVFPGGGTQFKGGVMKYVQFIEQRQTLPTIEWGRRTRVILDVGCGVASFGGCLLDKDVLTMSFAPKDEHEAQIQFALERGIPAFLSVIGTQRLAFPDNAFDTIHCARCRVHWDADGGKPLMELNRILRPGGFFIWSATPVYRDDTRDQDVWNAMVALTDSICWRTVSKSVDATGIGLVIYQKPVTNSCYEERKENNPLMCSQNDRPSISWYAPLDGCLPYVPAVSSGAEDNWPVSWPERLGVGPSSLSSKPDGRDTEEKFYSDTKQWDSLVSDVYLHVLPINWTSIRNVMDMNAGFGGFAAALIKRPLWVMNIVPIHEQDTLPIIFDRGLMGIFHDWCESFNTYPRTYDLLHSSFLFYSLAKRCDIIEVVAEMDRMLRPNGWVLIQDTKEMIKKLRPIFNSLHWVTTVHQQKFLVGKKSFWRPS